MRVRELELRHIQVPLRFSFTHSRASRKSTSNVIVRCVLDDGSVGFGEGVPRAYVTGETLETVWSCLENVDLDSTSSELANLSDAYAFAAAMTARIADDRDVINNAARCALELAILDACGHALSQHVGDGLAKHVGTRPGPVCPHSLVLGRERRLDESWIREMISEFGFTAAKIKVGFDPDEDRAAIALVRKLFGAGGDLRLDANRGWQLDEAAAFMDHAATLGIVAVEDPLAGATLEDMAPALGTLRREHGVSIILDEPIRTSTEAARAIELDTVDTFNIRVSKNGGLLGAARIASLAQQHQVAIQVGTQVGETAILSAAGRILAHAAGPVRYYEGSAERLKYDLEHFIASDDLTFGADATSPALDKDGLGITVLEERIRKLTTRTLRRAAR